jgi:hypothetical protein
VKEKPEARIDRGWGVMFNFDILQCPKGLMKIMNLLFQRSISQNTRSYGKVYHY